MCNPNSSALAYRRQRAAALFDPLLELAVAAKGGSSQASPTFSTSFLWYNKGSSDYDVADEKRFHNEGFTAPQFIRSTFAVKPAFEDIFTFSSEPSSMHCSVPKPIGETTQLLTKPKRRRKPQKPGKTAKQNDRHFVVHNYHDHANDEDDEVESPSECGRRRGGVTISFPAKLHSVLDQVEQDGLANVVSWQPHGRCFVIHKPQEFTDHIMPHYFRQSKLTSFQRQLNLYGFNRITRGHDAGGYYHELFLRGKEFLCKHMIRTKVKGTRFKAASSPEQEPDFYSMAPVIVTPPTSDCDSSDHDTVPAITGVGYAASATKETSDYPPIGNPERYLQYSSPRRAIAVGRHQVPEMSPLPYSTAGFATASVAPLMTNSFDLQDSPRNSVSNPQMVTQDHVILDRAVDELFLGGEGGIHPSRLTIQSSIL
jgi:hypothetical protein